MASRIRPDQARVNRYHLARRAEVKEQVLADIFDVITAFMEEGVTVNIRGFGNFVPEVKPARIVKSPLVPGGQKKIGRRRVIKFQMARTLKKEWTEKDGGTL